MGLAVLASGCIRLETDIQVLSETDIDVDQSVVVKFSDFDDELDCHDLQQEVEADLHERFDDVFGISSKPISRGGQPGCLLSYSLDLSDSSPDIGLEVTRSGNSLTFAMDNTGVSAATGALEGILADEGVSFDELLDEEIVDSWAEIMDLEGSEVDAFREEMRPEFSLSISFPGKVTSASHDGRISGNTVTWDGSLWENIGQLDGIITATGKAGQGFGSALPSLSDITSLGSSLASAPRPLMLGGFGALAGVGLLGAFLLGGSAPKVTVAHQKPTFTVLSAAAAVGVLGLGGALAYPLLADGGSPSSLLIDYPTKPNPDWTYSMSTQYPIWLIHETVDEDTVVLAPRYAWYDVDESEIEDFDITMADDDFRELIALDAHTGKEKWRSDIAPSLGSSESLGFVELVRIPDSNNFLLISIIYDEYPTVRLATINSNTGAVQSHTRVEHMLSVPAEDFIPVYSIIDDTVLVGTYDWDTDELPTAHAYSLKSLDSGPLWSTEVPTFFQITPLGDDYALFGQRENGFALEISTGRLPDWAGDQQAGEWDEFFSLHNGIDDHLLRVEGNNEFFEITGIDKSGNKTWGRSIDAEWMSTEFGVLLVSDGHDWPIPDGTMRIDPSTGEGMWDAPLRGEFDRLLSGTDTHMFLLDERDRVLSINLDTGEIDARIPVREGTSLYNSIPGKNLVYLIGSEEIIAIHPEQSEPLWAMRLRDRESFIEVGKYIGVFNSDRATLTTHK